jgi:predicted transcriptional regulator
MYDKVISLTDKGKQFLEKVKEIEDLLISQKENNSEKNE